MKTRSGVRHVSYFERDCSHTHVLAILEHGGERLCPFSAGGSQFRPSPGEFSSRGLLGATAPEKRSTPYEYNWTKSAP